MHPSFNGGNFSYNRMENKTAIIITTVLLLKLATVIIRDKKSRPSS